MSQTDAMTVVPAARAAGCHDIFHPGGNRGVLHIFAVTDKQDRPRRPAAGQTADKRGAIHGRDHESEGLFFRG